MKRIGQAAKHISDETRQAMREGQKARWAKAKNDVSMKKEQKTTSQVSDALYIQLQKENELLRAEINFYRNLILDLKKAA